jgi:hypothetical protein
MKSLGCELLSHHVFAVAVSPDGEPCGICIWQGFAPFGWLSDTENTV